MNIKRDFLKTIKSLGRYILTIGLFAAAAAFALILARGNTITEGGISPTGTIRLTSDSLKDIQAYLNDQHKPISSSGTLDSIMPGTYILRLERTGYTSWEGEVRVDAGIVTDVAFQLFPEELQLNQIDTKNISQIFFAPDRSRIYYFVTDSQLGTNIGLWQYDLTNPPFGFGGGSKELKLSDLNSLVKTAVENSAVDIIPSPDNRRLLLNTGTEVYIIDTNRYNEPSRTNQLNLTYPIDQISWINDSNNLALVSGNLLVNYQINNSVSTIIAFNGVSRPVFSIADNTVFFISEGKLFQHINGINSPVSLSNIKLPENITQVVAAENEPNNLILEAAGILYYLNTEQSILQTIGQFELLNTAPDGTSILVGDAQENIKSVTITVSQILDKVEINIRPAKVPKDVDLITIKWAENSAYLVYSLTSNKTHLFTADRRGNNIRAILEGKNLKVMDYVIKSDKTGLVLVLSDETGKNTLYELKFTGS